MKRSDFILGLGPSSSADRALLLQRALELGLGRVNTPDTDGLAAFTAKFTKKSNLKIQTHFHLRAGGQTLNELFEQTCAAMGVNELETYSFENIEDLKTNPQSLIELAELKKKGRLQNIGVFVDSEASILAASKIPSVQVLQVSFNLIENSLRWGSALKKAAEAGKTLQARAPFLRGALIRPLESLPENLQAFSPSVKKLKDLAGRSKMPMESLCLAYVLQQKLFSAVIVGAESKDQLVKNWQAYQSASRLQIQSDEIHRITQEDSKNLNLSSV